MVIIMKWKEWLRNQPYYDLRYYPNIRLEGLRKIMKPLIGPRACLQLVERRNIFRMVIIMKWKEWLRNQP
jgi:hypothetical protein